MALAGRLNRLRSDMDARILALRADTSDWGSIPRRPPGMARPGVGECRPNPWSGLQPRRQCAGRSGRAAPPDGSRRAGEAAQRTKAELPGCSRSQPSPGKLAMTIRRPSPPDHTSGAGFVGSQIADVLLAEGCRSIIAVDSILRRTPREIQRRVRRALGSVDLRRLSETMRHWVSCALKPIRCSALWSAGSRDVPPSLPRAFDLHARVQATHGRLGLCADIVLEDAFVDSVDWPGATRAHSRALPDTRP